MLLVCVILTKNKNFIYVPFDQSVISLLEGYPYVVFVAIVFKYIAFK